MTNYLLPLFGKLPPSPGFVSADSLLGVRPAIGLLLSYVLVFVIYALFIFFLFFLLRRLFRKDWIAAIVVVLLGAGTNTGNEYPIFIFFAGVLIWLSLLLVLKYFGLLVLVVGLVVQNVLVVFPVTSHLSLWYAGAALAGLLAISALAVYGFSTALAGQPIFGKRLLEA